MTDTWEILVSAKDSEETLGLFEACRRDEYTITYVCVDFLEICRAPYTATGEIGCFHVLRNGKQYARIYPIIPFLVNPSQYLEGNLVVNKADLITIKVPPVCTCGGWAVYGREADIHADNVANTCDLRIK